MRLFTNKSTLFAFMVLGFVMLASRPVLAQDFSVFLGHWAGSGISETEDSIYFAVTVRDMDVVIEKVSDTSFKLTWTTVTRESGDPDNPNVKKRTAAITFAATGEPGVYRATDIGDPLKSEPVWWSRIEGTTLYTYMMMLNRDGTWTIQKYTRKVTDQGMSLTYERFADGEQARTVRGQMVKHGQ